MYTLIRPAPGASGVHMVRLECLKRDERCVGNQQKVVG
jgi:hypothetical protein